MYSENEIINNYNDGNIEPTNIDLITGDFPLTFFEENSLDNLKNENDILKGEIQRLQYENEKMKKLHEVPENFPNSKEISKKQKRKLECLSEISSPNVSKKTSKSSKKQDVTKQYEKFKSLISKMTNEKLPFTNIEIYKNPNTCSVSLIFENYNLIRLIREKNKFSNYKKPIENAKKSDSKQDKSVSSKKNYYTTNEIQIRNILISTSMMYRDVFAN